MTIGDESKEAQEEYLNIAGSYAIPIYWVDDSGSAYNGTAFVLNTGEKTFVVTAAHIYEDYLYLKSANKIVSCQLADVNFELDERLISIGGAKKIDVATFSISNTEIEAIKALEKCILYGSQGSWPPLEPKTGESVVIAGYPGAERLKQNKTQF